MAQADDKTRQQLGAATSGEAVVFTVVGYQEVEHLRACDNCGHEIKRLYTIKGAGQRHVVGSECVIILCGRAAVDRTERRAKRAATQFRKNTPPARPGETKADYVNRRVREMANAMTAYKAFLSFERGAFEHQSFKLARRAARIWKLPHEVNDRFRWVACRCQDWEHNGVLLPNLCNRHLRLHQLRAHYMRRIARKYGANVYDFDRPAWEVAKV